MTERIQQLSIEEKKAFAKRLYAFIRWHYRRVLVGEKILYGVTKELARPVWEDFVIHLGVKERIKSLVNNSFTPDQRIKRLTEDIQLALNELPMFKYVVVIPVGSPNHGGATIRQLMEIDNFYSSSSGLSDIEDYDCAILYSLSDDAEPSALPAYTNLIQQIIRDLLWQRNVEPCMHFNPQTSHAPLLTCRADAHSMLNRWESVMNSYQDPHNTVLHSERWKPFLYFQIPNEQLRRHQLSLLHTALHEIYESDTVRWSEIVENVLHLWQNEIHLLKTKHLGESIRSQTLGPENPLELEAKQIAKMSGRAMSNQMRHFLLKTKQPVRSAYGD